MRKIRILIHLTTILTALCLLAACQMTATVTGQEDKASGRPAMKTETPRPLSTAGSVLPGRAVDGGSLALASTPKVQASAGALTMETAVRRAVSWHPAVDEATGRIYQADERIRAAQAGYYPKLKAGVASGYQSSNREGWRPNFNISASQVLYDFGKVSSSVEIERAVRDISSARLILAIDDLSRDTANAVVELQRYKRLTALAQEQVEGVKRIAGLVNQRTDKGASTMSDKVQADARVESALSTQLQFQSELNRWQVALGADRKSVV